VTEKTKRKPADVETHTLTVDEMPSQSHPTEQAPKRKSTLAHRRRAWTEEDRKKLVRWRRSSPKRGWPRIANDLDRTARSCNDEYDRLWRERRDQLEALFDDRLAETVARIRLSVRQERDDDQAEKTGGISALPRTRKRN